jgi:hypothetical protein
MRRIAALFRVKANKALDRAEDPREVLDYSYEQQLEMMQKVRRGVADVATSRKREDLARQALRDPFPGSHRELRMTRQPLPKVAGRHHGPRELLAACIART